MQAEAAASGEGERQRAGGRGSGGEGERQRAGGREPDGVELDEAEREIVEAELAALLPALSGTRREGYEALAAAVARGSVPPELVVHLQSLLELALQTARARTLYRAEGEKLLTGVYRRTPAGRALTRQLADINSALRAVADHELRSARVGMRTLGHFTVTLQTDEARITLAVRPDGMNVDSVEVTDAAR